MTPDSLARTQNALREVSALLQAGKFAAGAGVLRRVLDRDPTNPAVVSARSQISATVRAWLTLGLDNQAAVLLAPVAESDYAGSTIWMLYANVLMALGRRLESATVLRRCLAQEPDNREVALMLAAVLADDGQAIEAESVVRKTIERGGGSADAAFVLGRALLGEARFDEAEVEFRKVVQAYPGHQTAQANLMELVWMRTGDVHAATRTIDKALRAQPGLIGLRVSKANLLVSAHEPREALAEIEAGLAVVPNDPGLLTSAVTVALDVDCGLAYAYASRLPASAAHNRLVQVAKGNAALAAGHSAEALAVADALCAMDATDGRAVAMRADALRMRGDDRYRELLDYTRLVRADYLDVPGGWGTLNAYLSDLVEDIGYLHTLHAHPIGNSLRNGSQIELDPSRSQVASIRAFPQAIDGPIRCYMQALGLGGDPMRSRNTGHYVVSGMWSVRLQTQGYHVSHYHPGGWISSACYLHLPPAVDARGGEGWLQFGEPPFHTRPTLRPEYMLKPEPGLLALFPSYMWHGTVPFSGASDDTRLTIAFDLLPSDGT